MLVGAELTIAITRMELSAGELRAEAGWTKDARVVRRLLALARVLDAHSREQAADSCGKACVIGARTTSATACSAIISSRPAAQPGTR